MLLIGDIHINTRYQDKILTELKTIFSKYPEEKNIIFFGDYVYHFAYDRNALLQLYKLFLELFYQGKNVYILSGNHDRLGNSFVFEEAQHAFNILSDTKLGLFNNQNGLGNIKFITKPTLTTIEGETMFLLPFFLPEQHTKITYTPTNEKLKTINNFANILQTSNNKNENFSGYINQLLLEHIDKHENLTILHHYYINGTSFPGQNSKFNYKNIALHEELLNIPTIKLISGHLHQPFTFNNYLCLGSIRSTTSLENNQNKYIFQYTPKDNTLTAISLYINPQITIKTNSILTESIFIDELKTIYETNKNYFTSSTRKINFEEYQIPKLTNISITLQVEDINYDKIDEIIESNIRTNCKEIRLKKNIQNIDNLLDSFKISSDQLKRFSDRKNVLQTYIKTKFNKDYPKYEKILKELKLI